MARAVILASGSGSNFQALAEAIEGTKHSLTALICDRKGAGCFERAEKLNISARYINYAEKKREAVEQELLDIVNSTGCDIIFLAGFMRLITPFFLDNFAGPVINIHPSLLPKYPGTHGIEESYGSGDLELGITIHKVDYGMDTGPVICQRSFIRSGRESLEEIEVKIHELEHLWYPKTAIELLDKSEINSEVKQ
ncbi:MAG: phosphoribosylglycinamide formyltransferase [Spirochaetales bacterium]|nr:phosphoribosylglycinamide formyltransferase [Spirochaetales bacterium]